MNWSDILDWAAEINREVIRSKKPYPSGWREMENVEPVSGGFGAVQCRSERTIDGCVLTIRGNFTFALGFDPLTFEPAYPMLEWVMREVRERDAMEPFCVLSPRSVSGARGKVVRYPDLRDAMQEAATVFPEYFRGDAGDDEE